MADAPYARILVALDFSEISRRALREAVRLASVGSGARVRLVHACPLPVIPPGAGASATGAPSTLAVPRMEETLREAASQALEEEARVVREAGLEAELEVGLGPPSSTVLRAARDWPADLIVTGTRGASGFAHVLVGSVAERILREAPCPVLAVRGDDEPVRRASHDDEGGIS